MTDTHADQSADEPDLSSVVDTRLAKAMDMASFDLRKLDEERKADRWNTIKQKYTLDYCADAASFAFGVITAPTILGLVVADAAWEEMQNEHHRQKQLDRKRAARDSRREWYASKIEKAIEALSDAKKRLGNRADIEVKGLERGGEVYEALPRVARRYLADLRYITENGKADGKKSRDYEETSRIRRNNLWQYD